MSGWLQGSPPPNPLVEEIERIKGIVGKYFPIYNVQLHFDTVSLFCNIDSLSLEQKFDALRIEMKGMAYVPVLVHERGEYVIHVVRTPKAKFRSVWVNLVFFIATIATTILAGSVLWGAVFDSGGIFEPGNLGNGALFFALPLMLILGIHELGHYFAARRHGIAASLPFFIPIPPVLFIPIGTMGAFISIREPIPSKKSLLDIGVAGPIAGLIVAIPVTAVGLLLSTPLEASTSPVIEGGTTLIGESLLFYAMRAFLPVPDNAFLHPMAFAGWVGLFVTALNLLPAGQLDGGHIARALLGDRAKWMSYGAFGLMVCLGLFTGYTGWLFFAFLIMFLGMRHPAPLNDVTGLDNRRKALGAVTAVILVLCFVPVPFAFQDAVYDADFNLVMADQSLRDAISISEYGSNSQWFYINQTVRVANTGNIDANVSIDATSSNTSVCHAHIISNGTAYHDGYWANLSAMEMENLTVVMALPPGAVGNVTVNISAEYFYHEEEVDRDWSNVAVRNLKHTLAIYLEIRSYP